MNRIFSWIKLQSKFSIRERVIGKFTFGVRVRLTRPKMSLNEYY